MKWHGYNRIISCRAVVNDPILKRLRAALDELYGGRIERVVLMGSRARGDACEDSDYDVAVFLRDMPDRFAEMNRRADLSTDKEQNARVGKQGLRMAEGRYRHPFNLKHLL